MPFKPHIIGRQAARQRCQWGARPTQMGKVQICGSLWPETASLWMHLKSLSLWLKETGKGHKEERDEGLYEFTVTPQPSIYSGLSACLQLVNKQSFNSACPKHLLRAGPRLQRPGQVSRPHVNRSVIVEKQETNLRQTGTAAPVSNLLICFCSITQLKDWVESPGMTGQIFCTPSDSQTCSLCCAEFPQALIP